MDEQRELQEKKYAVEQANAQIAELKRAIEQLKKETRKPKCVPCGSLLLPLSWH